MTRSGLGGVNHGVSWQLWGLLAVSLVVALPLGAVAAEIVVTSTDPVRNTVIAPVATAVSVEFDLPLDTATITGASFRVFGKISGKASGSFSFSNGNRTVTLTPSQPFSAGEVVLVNLADTIRAADTSPLRTAGYAFQFTTATQPSTRIFHYVTQMSNRSHPVVQTRIYGAMAADLNGDRYPDLATVNEVSADVRVFLNRGDGSGEFIEPFLTPVDIGDESSPNESADFDNDGKVDAAISSTSSERVYILRGDGSGGFPAVQFVQSGQQPHGVAVLDVDGDGDLDIANSNRGSNNLSLMINNGSGVFGAATMFDSGLDGEYGLASGDMNNDGITDLIVGSNGSDEIRTLLGNGNGTFTPAAAQSSGGPTWVVVVGDINGDGNLDASTANSFDGTSGILLGNGDGTFAAPTLVNVGAHLPSTDLGDLDGDGDLDLVLSSYGGSFWRTYENDGTGAFTFDDQINAPNNPSCAVLYDSDGDGDLDLALSDEIADVVMLMENADPSLCAPMPQTCRVPVPPGRSTLLIRNRSLDPRDTILWRWMRGETTMKSEFGNPLVDENYELCFYDDDTLVYGIRVPAAQTCKVGPCWKDLPKSFLYRNRQVTPQGVGLLRLREGLTDGTTMLRLAGRSARLDLPDFSGIGGTLRVQLQKSSGGTCWGATFSQPFLLNNGITFKARSD